MSTGTDAEIVATCEAAATYLGEHGVADCMFLDDDGAACLAGALLIATSGTEQVRSMRAVTDAVIRACPAMSAVATVIGEMYPQHRKKMFKESSASAWTIFDFNDDDDTTQADVIEVLRETIKRHTPDEYRAQGTE